MARKHRGGPEPEPPGKKIEEEHNLNDIRQKRRAPVAEPSGAKEGSVREKETPTEPRGRKTPQEPRGQKTQTLPSNNEEI